MESKSLLLSEEVIETGSILTILSPKNAPRIIGGKDIRKAFKSYKSDNVEKYLAYINKMESIKITP